MDRETSVARKRVKDAETAIAHEQEDMRNADESGLTTRKPEQTYNEMLNGIGDSLSNLASSDNEEDGDNEEDVEDDTDQGKLSEDNEPSRVIGKISKPVEQRTERFWQIQMRFDEFKLPGWGDMANHFHEIVNMYRMAKLQVVTVVKLQMKKVAALSAPTTFGVHMETIGIVPGTSQMPQWTSCPGSSHMILGSQKPQLHKCIASLPPDTAPNSPPIKNSKPGELISFYLCI